MKIEKNNKVEHRDVMESSEHRVETTNRVRKAAADRMETSKTSKSAVRIFSGFNACFTLNLSLI